VVRAARLLHGRHCVRCRFYRSCIVANSVQHLAYELTRGSLSEQEQRLSDLRTRTGTILAAASIPGSFLGAQEPSGISEKRGGSNGGKK
jgi:hypothetical protein